MNVMIYVEKQADLGETCLLLQDAGLTNIETKPHEAMILGQIDAAKADQLVKVKGVDHMRKGPYIQPPFLPQDEVFNPAVQSVLPGTPKPHYRTFPTTTRVNPVTEAAEEKPKKKTKKKNGK